MTPKTIISVILALAVAGLVVYVMETHARPWIMFGGLLAGTVLSFGLLLLRNKLALFVEVLALALLAYFAWKWDVREIAVSAPVGAVIGAFLVWGWVHQHKPYRHSEYQAKHHVNDDNDKREVPR